MKYSIAFIPAFAATGMSFPLFNWAREVPSPEQYETRPQHHPSGHYVPGATSLPGPGPYGPGPFGPTGTGIIGTGTGVPYPTGTGAFPPSYPTGTGVSPPFIPTTISTEVETLTEATPSVPPNEFPATSIPGQLPPVPTPDVSSGGYPSIPTPPTEPSGPVSVPGDIPTSTLGLPEPTPGFPEGESSSVGGPIYPTGDIPTLTTQTVPFPTGTGVVPPIGTGTGIPYPPIGTGVTTLPAPISTGTVPVPIGTAYPQPPPAVGTGYPEVPPPVGTPIIDSTPAAGYPTDPVMSIY